MHNMIILIFFSLIYKLLIRTMSGRNLNPTTMFRSTFTPVRLVKPFPQYPPVKKASKVAKQPKLDKPVGIPNARKKLNFFPVHAIAQEIAHANAKALGRIKQLTAANDLLSLKKKLSF